MKAREIAECCVCTRWAHGDWVPSGERDLRTRETPCDNFICDRCLVREDFCDGSGSTVRFAANPVRHSRGDSIL